MTDQATRSRPRILYACRANGGRSVISKVLTEHYGGDAIQVSSAGSEPGSKVHPEVVQALADLGLDASNEQPKSFDPTASYDVVITQGCGETCPVYLGARYEDWPLDDPKGQDPEVVRRIISEIDQRVRVLLRGLVPHRELPPSVFE